MSASSDSSSGHLPSALASVLGALLLDAAVETWWSGSPVRWWIVAAAAIYAVATVLLWKRTTWQGKATIAAVVFLGAMAITAWLPGGLSTGMRLLGRGTSTLLSLFVAAAVTLSAVVVWRFRAVPRAVRTGVVLLAAYGLIAFVYGVIAGVPFSELFGGGSVWRRLPTVLQGAFVGGVIVLPIAFADVGHSRRHPAIARGIAAPCCVSDGCAGHKPGHRSRRAASYVARTRRCSRGDNDRRVPCAGHRTDGPVSGAVRLARKQSPGDRRRRARVAARSLGPGVRGRARRQRTPATIQLGRGKYILDSLPRAVARARWRAHGPHGEQPRSRGPSCHIAQAGRPRRSTRSRRIDDRPRRRSPAGVGGRAPRRAGARISTAAWRGRNPTGGGAVCTGRACGRTCVGSLGGR